MLQEIFQALEARPFEPFSIVTSAGSRYFVPSAEHLFFNPKRTRVVIFFDDESSVVISALHIVSIEGGMPAAA